MRQLWPETGESLEESSERAFEAYGEPIKNVLAFKYLGRVLTAGDDNWLTEVGNLGKARSSWERLSPVLGREGADPKVSGTFYTAVAQMFKSQHILDRLPVGLKFPLCVSASASRRLFRSTPFAHCSVYG